MSGPISGENFNGVAPVAVVIGASSGIGRALVSQLLESTHWQAVYAGSRSAENAFSDYSDNRLQPLTIDCSNEQSVIDAFDAIKAKHQHIGLLIYCAGLLHNDDLQPEKRLADLCLKATQQSFAVNAFGPALVMQQAQPLLSKQPALLVNVSARVGSIDDNGLGGWYSYRAAKAAQNMFTRTACIEIGRRNKHFAGMAFHPGTTETPLSEPFRGNVSADKLFSPERAARQLLAVAGELTPDDNGCFRAWDGSSVAW